MSCFTLIITMGCNSEKWVIRSLWPNADVKNKLNYTSIPPTCLHGMDRDKFTFSFMCVCVCLCVCVYI